MKRDSRQERQQPTNHRIGGLLLSYHYYTVMLTMYVTVYYALFQSCFACINQNGALQVEKPPPAFLQAGASYISGAFSLAIVVSLW